jgi:hypothetical protein
MRDKLAADIDRIVRMTDHRNLISLSGHPSQGQFVVTGPQPWARSKVTMVGFCVQVRLRCGQFGSDMVFLRHADGSLITHENQCYYALGEEQVAIARHTFTMLPDDEDYTQGYRCANKVHERGFVVTGSASPAALLRGGIGVRVESAAPHSKKEMQLISIV